LIGPLQHIAYFRDTTPAGLELAILAGQFKLRKMAALP
jgi:hypothetical protein